MSGARRTGPGRGSGERSERSLNAFKHARTMEIGATAVNETAHMPLSACVFNSLRHLRVLEMLVILRMFEGLSSGVRLLGGLQVVSCRRARLRLIVDRGRFVDLAVER